MSMAMGGFFKSMAQGMDHAAKNSPPLTPMGKASPMPGVPMNSGVPQDNTFGDFPEQGAPAHQDLTRLFRSLSVAPQGKEYGDYGNYGKFSSR